MTDSVVVLGGGVGGLSAAHELATRGYDVTVYEANDRVGGKARSFQVPGTGEPGWPGEHGFRFFPGYYRHVTDTMARTPDGDGGTVADHLVTTDATLVASEADAPSVEDVGTPDSVQGWLDALQPGGEDLPASEQAFFAERLLELLTSCERRRVEELDHQTWWEFVEADRMSPAFQRLAGSTQSLVALAPRRASARTVGRIFFQLLRGNLDPRLDAERILDGPTSETWLDPWRTYLESLDVAFVTGATVTDLDVDGGAVTGATVDHGGDDETVRADHHVAAVPVEAMQELLTPELRRAAPELRGVDELDTAWMNGLQFYLDEDEPLVAGHQLYRDSPWALTAISQAQFWDQDLRARTDGEIEGVLSVIVSDWERPGTVVGKPARECTPEELREEVWAQLQAHLDGALEEGAVVDWFLDPELRATDDGFENGAPLLVNTVGSYDHRPSADPGVEGLTLAADYVQTNSDLASMESAAEAGRRAAAAVLDAAGDDAARPKVWELPEPSVFDPLKAQDRVRYELGLPHPGTARREVASTLRRVLG
jgi:uncharacterized protein with NAD-binding domain and iron-sulfur cluster